MFHFRDRAENLRNHSSCCGFRVNILTNSAYVNAVLFQYIHIKNNFIEIASHSIHGITYNRVALTDCFCEVNPSITIEIGSGFARVHEYAVRFHTSIN